MSLVEKRTIVIERPPVQDVRSPEFSSTPPLRLRSEREFAEANPLIQLSLRDQIRREEHDRLIHRCLVPPLAATYPRSLTSQRRIQPRELTRCEEEVYKSMAEHGYGDPLSPFFVHPRKWMTPYAT